MNEKMFSKIIPILHGVAFFANFISLLAHLFFQSLGIADLYIISVLIWVFNSYLFYNKSQKLEKGIVEIADEAKKAIEEISIEREAIGHAYNNVLDTIDDIDKRVLAKNGIFINIGKKEKLPN